TSGARLCYAAGLRGLRFHNLWHTVVTRLLSPDDVVDSIAGHLSRRMLSTTSTFGFRRSGRRSSRSTSPAARERRRRRMTSWSHRQSQPSCKERTNMHWKSVVLVTVCLGGATINIGGSSQDPIRQTHMMDLTHTLSAAFPIVPVPGITFPFDQK